MILLRDLLGILCFLGCSVLWIWLTVYSWRYLKWLEGRKCLYGDARRSKCRHREMKEKAARQQTVISLQHGQIVKLTDDLNETTGELLMLRLTK